MRFSIVTPSFRYARWLKLCIASVADQDLEHEHIVQDACSDDGTQDWLPQDRRVIAIIEKDQGMYDAINRGWRRARGELLAHLNSDEQYLPGTLRKVSDYFERHPEVDIVFGDVVVVGTKGDYICDRTALVPQLAHSLVSSNLSYLTAGAFMRRRLIEEHQLYFDTSYRISGDAEWATRLIKSGARMGLLGEFTSVFTETGHNLALNEKVAQEQKRLRALAPKWAQLLPPLVRLHFRLRRWGSGAYSCRPHAYAIYTGESPDRRKVFQVDKPTFRWVR